VSELQEFIHASKNKGASDEFLAALLIRRGWPEDAVYSALGDYWTAVTGVAVPQRKSSAESAREAFLYLLAFSTLCCWATALGSCGPAELLPEHTVVGHLADGYAGGCVPDFSAGDARDPERERRQPGATAIGR
jgi:hypothetical protein